MYSSVGNLFSKENPSLAVEIAKVSLRPLRMVTASRSATSQSKLYTPLATLKTASAGSWRIAQARPSSQETHFSMEVSNINSNTFCQFSLDIC